jgi:AraC-like DNA-binding protein
MEWTMGIDYLADKKISRLVTGVSEHLPVRCIVNVHPSRGNGTFDMHYALEMGVLLEGCMIRYYRHWETRCRAGDAWLCGPWEPHGHKVLTAPSRALVLVFSLGFLSKASDGKYDLFAPFKVPPAERPRVVGEKKEDVLNIGRKLAEVIASPGKYTDLWLASKTVELLLILLESWRVEPAAVSPPDNEDYHRITRVLETAFRENTFIPMKEIAAAAGMNRNMFSRKFRQVMGIGFPDFMLRHRLSGAASDLTGTGLSIDEIALKWGFSDKSHLHHRFRELYACNPGEYRRQILDFKTSRAIFTPVARRKITACL